MRFPTPLVPGRLIRRYKRFLADIALEDGREVTAHCPNPGAMLNFKEPGTRVWVEPNDDPKKKLKYGWRLVELPWGAMAGIDTGVPNRVVGEALAEGRITELADYPDIRAEVAYGKGSRVDFLVRGPELSEAYVEVKNVNYRREDDWAEFPDCVTDRGAKHLIELAEMAERGHRAVLLYVVQRNDCGRVKLAPDLDPHYARTAVEAVARGVEMMAYGTEITPDGVRLTERLPFEL